MILLHNRWLICIIAILFGILDLLLISYFTSRSTLATIILIIIAIPLFYNIILEFYVAMIFISPGSRKPSIDDSDWIHNSLSHDGPDVYFLTNFRDDESPMMIMIHGWRSSSKSMHDRARLYIEKGYHVLIMELPGHGNANSISKWNAGITTSNLLFLMDNLDSVINMSLISKIFFHGHSIGGFVLLKYSKESSTITNNDLVKGFILESPMTCYSKIFQEVCSRLFIPNIFQKRLWTRLTFHFSALNPNFPKINSFKDVDVPKWGIPVVKTLVVQAGTDERLGPDHYNNLVQSFNQLNRDELLTNMIIEDLTHAGARTNSKRDKVITKWLDSF